MKIIKTFISLFIICIFVYIAYLFKFQQLVNKGSIIADKQCMNVNPLIIQRKNSYLKSMKIIMDKGSIEDYQNELKNYITASNKFIVEQEKWLKEQKDYMNGWDYKFFIIPEIKELGRLQYLSREADMKGARALLDLLKTTNVDQQKKYVKIMIDQVRIAKDAVNKYDLLWKKGTPINLRTRFIKVPPSKCPKENFDIPNVPDLLSPPTQINNSPFS